MRVLSVYSTTDVGRKKVSNKLQVVKEVIGYEIPDSNHARARVVALWYLSNGRFMEVSEQDLLSPSSMTAYAMLSLLSADMWLTEARPIDE